MILCIYFCFTALFNQVIVTETEYAFRTHFTGILTNIVWVCTEITPSECSVLFTRCLESSCCNLCSFFSVCKHTYQRCNCLRYHCMYVPCWSIVLLLWHLLDCSHWHSLYSFVCNQSVICGIYVNFQSILTSCSFVDHLLLSLSAVINAADEVCVKGLFNTLTLGSLFNSCFSRNLMGWRLMVLSDSSGLSCRAVCS